MGLLLLMDINGTLAARKGSRTWVLRPYIRELFKFLDSHDDIEYHFYTSMSMRNASLAFDKLSVYLDGLLRPDARLFAQEYNRRDPETAHRYMRDFRLVWQALGLPESEGYRRTLMIDDERRKFRRWPNNGVELPTFGTYDAEDVALPALIACLERILRCNDVRESKAQAVFDLCYERVRIRKEAEGPVWEHEEEQDKGSSACVSASISSGSAAEIVEAAKATIADATSPSAYVLQPGEHDDTGTCNIDDSYV